MATPCLLVEVSGSPRERGRQYGEQARDRVRLGIAHYSEQLAASRLLPDDIRRLVARFEPTIAGFDGAYLEEMRGISEGAGAEYESIVLINARTEILKLAQRRQSGQDEPDGCTGLVALPEATREGRLIHAQNWDWKVECAETAVVLKISRTDGPDILTFTEAGALARSGFNAAGIAITANYLECDRDYRRLGVPLALIRRKVLEQASLALAMRAVYVTPKSGANNMIVSQAAGLAIDFECAPDETFQVHPQSGLIVHANHFQSPIALAKLKDTGIANTPDSLYRDIRVREKLAPAIGAITRETVKAALFDDFEAPWSVCRPPRPNLSNNLSATVAMIVMEPALGIMEVAMLPALNRAFQVFALDMHRRAPANDEPKAATGAKRPIAAAGA
jgi:isopenicillin-N N-acyltransferase-like protein